MTRWLDRLKNFTRVALDTNAVIYFLDRTPPYYPLLDAVFGCAEGGTMEVVVPTLAETELLVGLLRNGDTRAQVRLTLLLDHFPGVSVAPLDRAAAQAAAGLRAALGLATPDAILIGTAVSARCQAVIGNDKTCAARVTAPEYVYLSDFVS